MNKNGNLIFFNFCIRFFQILCIVVFFISCEKNENFNFLSENTFIRGNHGITNSSQNINIPIAPNAESRFIVIENPHLNKISFTYKNSNHIIEAGDYLPFYKRSIINRFFVFEISPSIKNDTINLIFDKSGENLSYAIRLLNKSAFNSYIQKDNFIIGITIGVYLLAIVIAMFFYIKIRSLKILFFLLYIFFSLLWILNDAGVLYQFLWPNSPIWHNSTRGFLSSITILLFALYIKENKNKIFSKNLNRIIIVVICSTALKLFLTFVVAKGIYPEKLKYISSHLNALIFLFLFLVIIIFLIFEIFKHPKDVFEILSIITYCFFVISLVLNELGYDFLIIENIHKLQALPFFFLQLIFMSIHIFKLEEELENEQKYAFIAYKINQEREFDNKILLIEENEKKRIAQNIHDEIGGIFVSLKYQLLTLKEKTKDIVSQKMIEKLIEVLNLGVKKQYSIVEDLLLEFNNENTFLKSLEEYIRLAIPNLDIIVKIEYEISENKLTTLQKTQIFRIFTELITNTIKHANATVIEISILETEKIKISYVDNGVGYDESNVQNGNGIQIIKRRINALKGEIEYIRLDNKSFYVILIPYNNE